MGNAHNQFLQFEKAISLSSAKKRKLIASRIALEERVREHFKAHANFLTPKFYIQGSYKMGTMVIKRNCTYDVDLGVYFLEKPKISALSVQTNVFKAVNGHTISGVEHRDKCVRVIYKDDFDIDLPVYYKTSQDKNPFLATKKGWQKSDPKELCDWFEKQRKEKDKAGQMLRVVKYFKIWASQRDSKMPSGIAFSVWVANNYKSHSRDDKAFFETAKAIERTFGGGFTDTVALNPATPQDNLLKLDFDQRTKFKETYRQMLKHADQAIQANSNQKALNIWKQLFGEKFPLL